MSLSATWIIVMAGMESEETGCVVMFKSLDHVSVHIHTYIEAVKSNLETVLTHHVQQTASPVIPKILY